MRETLIRLLAHSPLQVWMGRRNRSRLAVLAMHRVDDPATFRRLMEALVDGYAPVSLEQVLAGVEGAGDLPEAAVLLTFDDGHPSVLHHGVPILRELGIPAVLFVIAGLVGGRRPPWWEVVEAAAGPAADEEVRALKRLPDEERRRRVAEWAAVAEDEEVDSPQLTSGDLVELERAGIEIGNHTWSHPVLPRCDAKVVEWEIESAHRRLAEDLGHPPRAFAYPNGDHDPRAGTTLRRLGYRAAFGFDHRLAHRRPADRFHISRLRLDSDSSQAEMALTLSGLHPWLYHLRRGARP